MMAAVRSLPGTLLPGDLLRIAIRERRLVTFTLHGLPLRAEPHDYGVANGEPTLAFYQVSGHSKPGHAVGWRSAPVSGMTDLLLLDIRFTGPRDSDPGRQITWDRLLASVSLEVVDVADEE